MRRSFALLCAAPALFAGHAGAQNLLRNPGFEDIPDPPLTGQGVMPSEWFPISLTPDTYSNDGSYGLSPSAFGNFPGVTAASGLRWVAGAQSISLTETFAQTLTTPLTPGATYRLSGVLHEAIRADLTNPGAYTVALATGPAGQGAVAVGRWDETTGEQNGWEPRSFTFVAPPDADSRPVIVFVPTFNPDSRATTYPGLDDVVLELVPGGDCPGDVNGNGVTDVFDFADLAANFGAGPGATRAQGDLNGDGFVDVFDFSDLAADFGCGV
jgi:hypothetical protein